MKKKLYQLNGAQFIEKEIRLLFRAIEETKDYNDAQIIFKILEEIQWILAKASFSDNLDLPIFLTNFIRDFARIDSDDVKKMQYQKIKDEDNL